MTKCISVTPWQVVAISNRANLKEILTKRVFRNAIWLVMMCLAGTGLQGQNQFYVEDANGIVKSNQYGQLLLERLNDSSGSPNIWQLGQRQGGSFDISYGMEDPNFGHIVDNADNVVIKALSNGFIGIGKLNPEHRLDVSGNGNFEGQIIKDGGTGFFKVNNFGHVMMQHLNNANGLAKMWQIGQRNDGSFDISYGSVGMDFVVNSSNNVKVKIDTIGRVGIGNLTPDANLHIKMNDGSTPGLRIENDGNTNAWSFGIPTNDLLLQFNGTTVGVFDQATGNYMPSDERLKHSIQSFDDGVLEDIMRLRPAKYYYNHVSNPERREYGFVAQEIEKVFPEIVKPSEESGYLMIKYSDLIPILTKAMQEQQMVIDDHAEEIIQLHEALETLQLEIKRIAASVGTE